jgi:hypothetical protein
MTDTIKSFQTKIKIGAEQSYKNLAMFPLLSDYSISSKYLTMNEALSNGLIERDSMDEIKSVPKFKIANISDDNDCVAASWDYIEQFARVDGQIGVIFLINGKIAGMVCLDRTKTFEISFIKEPNYRALETYRLLGGKLPEILVFRQYSYTRQAYQIFNISQGFLWR